MSIFGTIKKYLKLFGELPDVCSQGLEDSWREPECMKSQYSQAVSNGEIDWQWQDVFLQHLMSTSFF